MRRLVLLPALAASLSAQAADFSYGRLFYTTAERAALEDARRRNIRAEVLAAEAAKEAKKAKQASAPRPRKVAVTGIVQRSDGASIAWVNGAPVESETKDGLRVRHAAGQTGVLLYDPDKRRAVSVKVGQQVDLTTGRIEESYQTRRTAARPSARQDAPDETSAASAASARNGVANATAEPSSATERSALRNDAKGVAKVNGTVTNDESGLNPDSARGDANQGEHDAERAKAQ